VLTCESNATVTKGDAEVLWPPRSSSFREKNRPQAAARAEPGATQGQAASVRSVSQKRVLILLRQWRE
jgi:hypothetical protein